MDERIVRIASRGDGVTASGRHAALAAPGDLLRDDGTVAPGPHHADPPCRHFPACGGCALQHLDPESEAAYVADRVATALAVQGIVTTVRAPVLSPPATRRRATLHAERHGRRILLGFLEGGSHRIVDMAECHILLPQLFALVAPLRGLLAMLMPERSRLDVHLSWTAQGTDLLLRGAIATGLDATEALTAFAQAHGLARIAVDEGMGPETRWEPEPVTVRFGDVAVPFAPAGFLQATAEGEAALVDAMREAVGDARTIADLFAGSGTFTFAQPPSTRVYAGEAAREPILALKVAAARAGRAVFADHRDLFRRPLTTVELERFDVIVLDPPRAGAREQVAALAGATVPRIAYISCNPGTFARDARMLCDGGYGLAWVQPVGQFRWSTHVELVGLFLRQSG